MDTEDAKALNALERFLYDREKEYEKTLQTVDVWSDTWDEAWGALHVVRSARLVLEKGEYSREAYYNQEYGIVLHEEQLKEEGEDNA